MAEIKILNPESLGKPLGQYSQLTRVKASEFLFIAGQVGIKPGDGKAPAISTRNACSPSPISALALASQGARFRQSRRVHHLSRALAGHPKIHGLSHARISQAVCRRRLSAEHAA